MHRVEELAEFRPGTPDGEPPLLHRVEGAVQYAYNIRVRGSAVMVLWVRRVTWCLRVMPGGISDDEGRVKGARIQQLFH